MTTERADLAAIEGAYVIECDDDVVTTRPLTEADLSPEAIEARADNPWDGDVPILLAALGASLAEVADLRAKCERVAELVESWSGDECQDWGGAVTRGCGKTLRAALVGDDQ